MKTNLAFKIVLMSATINQKAFVEYFDGAPAIEIPGRTFPVQDRMLNQTKPIKDSLVLRLFGGRHSKTSISTQPTKGWYKVY